MSCHAVLICHESGRGGLGVVVVVVVGGSGRGGLGVVVVVVVVVE